MRSLIWKEWHEQRWKLGFGSLVLASLAFIGLRARVIPDETMMDWVCFIGVGLLPVLASTGLVPPERSDGSFESLLALPVAPWRILWAKTAMGVLLCIGPLAAAEAVSFFVAGEREVSNDFIRMLFGRTMLAGLSLFIWMLALTIRLPNETRAGLLAMGVLIFWVLATAGLASSDQATLSAASPFAFTFGFLIHAEFQAPSLDLALSMQGLIFVLLWIWTAKRLAGLEDRS